MKTTNSVSRLIQGGAILLLMIGSASAEDWMSFGRSMAGAHAVTEIAPNPVSALWGPVAAGGTIYATPITPRGLLIVAAGMQVNAYREGDGSTAWAAPFTADDAIIGTPSVYWDVLVVPARWNLYGLDSLTGQLLWHLPLNGDVFSSVAMRDGKAWLTTGSPDNALLGVDILTGTVSLRVPLGNVSYSTPAADANRVYVADNSGTLRAIDPVAGTVLWSFVTAGAVSMTSPLVTDGLVDFVPGGGDLNLYRVDAATGAAANGFPVAYDNPYGAGWTNVRVSSLARHNEHVYFVAGEADLVLFCYNDQGEQVWTYPLGARSMTLAVPTPAVGQEFMVAVGQEDRTVRILHPDSGALLTSFTVSDTMFASPILANGRVFIATMAGNLYALRSANSPPDAAVPVSPAQDSTVSTTATPTLTWSEPVDADDPATDMSVTLRVDTDGEILRDWLYEQVLPGNVVSWTLASPVADGTRVSFALRTKDANGARSPWSTVQSFWVGTVPAAPENLRVTAEGDGTVSIAWDPPFGSPSLTSYRVAYGLDGQAALVTADHASATQALTFTGLTNAKTYFFEVCAIDLEGDAGATARVTAMPKTIGLTLNGIVYYNLQDVLNAAVSGDTISITYGTLYVNDTLTIPSGVSFVGNGASYTTVTGSGKAQLVSITTDATFLKARSGKAAPTVLANLTLVGDGAGIGIDVGTADVVIRNVVVTGCATAVRVGDADGNGGEVTIDLVTLANNAADGVEVRGGTVLVRNAIVQDNGGYGIRATGGVVDTRYSNFWNNAFGAYTGVRSGPGEMAAEVNFEADPLFLESADAPTIDAGDPDSDFANEPAPNGGRVNMGAYGNTVKARASAGAPPEESIGGGAPVVDDETGTGTGGEIVGGGAPAPAATSSARRSSGGGGCFLAVPAAGAPLAGPAGLLLLALAAVGMAPRRR